MEISKEISAEINTFEPLKREQENIMKSKIYVTILFFLFMSRTNLSGQTNHLELSVSPTLSYRNLVQEYVNHQIGLRYDFGLDYFSTINSTVVFGTGLGYSRMGYNARLDTYAPNGSVYRAKLSTSRNFVELPIFMGYWVKKQQKKPVLLSLSFVNQVLVSQIVKTNDSESNIYNSKDRFSDIRYSNLKIYNIAVKLGATYEHNLVNNISIKYSPFFKYGLMNMNNIHDFSLGLKIGLGYYL